MQNEKENLLNLGGELRNDGASLTYSQKILEKIERDRETRKQSLGTVDNPVELQYKKAHLEEKPRDDLLLPFVPKNSDSKPEDLSAMKNYLAEISSNRRPSSQMTYYNHYKSNLQDAVFGSHSPAEPPLQSSALAPSSSFQYQSRVDNSSLPLKFMVPSVYVMNEDLKQLTQSILPPK